MQITPTTDPVRDANGNPVTLPEHVAPSAELRAFMAGRVPASCGHYIAAREAAAGFDRCERCSAAAETGETR